MPLEGRESVFGDGARWTPATIKGVHSCTNTTDETLPASFDAVWYNSCCAPQLLYELFPTGVPRKPHDDVLLIYLHASSHSRNNYEYHATNVSAKITFYRGVHGVVYFSCCFQSYSHFCFHSLESLLWLLFPLLIPLSIISLAIQYWISNKAVVNHWGVSGHVLGVTTCQPCVETNLEGWKYIFPTYRIFVYSTLV